MSVLLAILYPSPTVADEVLETVENLARDGHLDIEDSCAVVKDAKGKVHLHQENNLSVFGAIGGLALGTFLGWFVWLPYLGIPGAIIGAMAGGVSDRGINDMYMKDASEEMDYGSSALFMLLRSTSPETVLLALAPYGGRIFHTSLDNAAEAELVAKLERLKAHKKQEAEQSPSL